MWFCFDKEKALQCELQGRKCSGRVLGGPWYGLIAAVAITFFIGWVLAPLVAWALTGWTISVCIMAKTSTG